MVMSLEHYSMNVSLHFVIMLIKIQDMCVHLRQELQQHMALHLIIVRLFQRKAVQEASIILQDLGDRMLI